METFVSEEEAAQFREYMADPSARAAFVEFKAEAAENGTARRYEHVLRAVASRPWAIHEPMLAIIVDVLTFRAFGGRLTAEEIEGRIGAARRTPSSEGPRGVARIPISGVIMPKAGGFEQMSGGTSAEAIGKSIRSAVNSPDVSSIVLDIDSPGGAVDGIPELAALIADANQVKPVTAVANHEAQSAAYWLASQAGRIVASPSARVGSIGVITRHEDQSAKSEKEGVKTTLVSAGKFKAEGSPWAPLSEEAQSHLQAMVDEFYGMFVEAVARGRGVTAEAIKAGFGEGRTVTANTALSLGMIDGIGTIEAVIAEELRSSELRGDHPAAIRPAAPALRVVGHEPPPNLEGAGPVGTVGHVGVTGQPGEQAPVVVNIAGTTANAQTVAKAVREQLGDGTPQDEEIERLRQELHSEPEAADVEDPTAPPVVEQDALPEGPEDPEIQALRDELGVLALPE